ncbi:MAG TPA: prepilin-type N-terminal cleavage/methylation domain-containing protein [Phycisphaerae bacterium]|nr:prepilin-type N-terminal cleavage/methylation domain-containing protein [Phycisphaerales bacterium]HRX85463.1 prepilin-type N-terminal cleavage/methylation domain-containing protein [Phycisphaerae bacterium]
MTTRPSSACARCPRRTASPRRLGGFTLVELLVVVALIALLMALLLPGLRRARRQARIVRTHAELRQVCIAVDAYAYDQRDQVPPTRSACGTDAYFQLPVELAEGGYLPRSPDRVPQADFPDYFQPTRTYRYRAPGALWLNGAFFDKRSPRAFLWVPEDFPLCTSDAGAYVYARESEPPSPVRYAVWSIGPAAEAKKFPRVPGFGTVDETKFPLPRAYWLTNSADEGIITHYRDQRGLMYQSP